MKERQELVFVYGTLRRGEKNHRLLANAKLLHEQSRIKGTLYDTGHGYPAVVLSGSGYVYGEVYAVDAEELSRLDELEDYRPGRSDNLYERVRQSIRTDQGELEAWVYVFERERTEEVTRLLPSGDWVHEQRKQDDQMLYFAYGSCMDTVRFERKRVEQLFTEVLGRGVLEGYELKFTRHATDGGRADIVETGGVVEGKLYQIGQEALTYLYVREGVRGKIYRPAWVTVKYNEQTLEKVLTFVVIDKAETELAPPEHYAEEILRGAKGIVSEAYYETLVHLCKTRWTEEAETEAETI